MGTSQSDSRTPLKLNIGCGTDIREGYLNCDKYPVDGRVRPFNLELDDYEDLGVRLRFDEILCLDVLEHVADLVPVMKKLRGMMQPTGKLIIRVPHFTSRNNFTDPTHKRQFGIRTFACFTANYRGRTHYLPVLFPWRLIARITFNKRLPYNWVVEPLINCCELMQTLYEETFLRALFPAENIEVEL